MIINRFLLIYSIIILSYKLPLLTMNYLIVISKIKMVSNTSDIKLFTVLANL